MAVCEVSVDVKTDEELKTKADLETGEPLKDSGVDEEEDEDEEEEEEEQEEEDDEHSEIVNDVEKDEPTTTTLTFKDLVSCVDQSQCYNIAEQDVCALMVHGSCSGSAPVGHSSI